jgi:hypothetical protein
MGGEQRDQVPVHRADDSHRVGVLGLVEPEPAVLRGDLDAESGPPPKLVDDRVGDAALAVDRVGVDLVAQEDAQALGPFPRLVGDEVLGVRVWVDRVEPKIAEKQVSDERPTRPVRLASRLRDPAGLRLADMSLRMP